MTEVGRTTLFKYLDELGIKTATVDHEPVFSVSESSQIDRALPGGHTKNLFLKDAKGRFFLVVAHSHTDVDLKNLPKRIGAARLSFGKPDRLQDLLGVMPGSVTAFAAMNDRRNLVCVIFDQKLMNFESINCHPLQNNATTNIARDDLLRFLKETGHEPIIVGLEKSDNICDADESAAG